MDLNIFHEYGNKIETYLKLNTLNVDKITSENIQILIKPEFSRRKTFL